MDNKTGETIEELFESLLEKYQGGLEEKMRGTDFSFFFIFFFFFFWIVLIYCIIIFIK